MNKRPNFHLLLHSSDLVEQQLRIKLAPLGVKPRQARVLDALDRMGAISQVELVKAFDITPASMSTMITRLVVAGFVTQKPSAKALRTNVVALSKRGRHVLNKVRVVWAEMDRVIEEAIGCEQAETLAQLTGALRDALGGSMPGDQ